MEEPSLLSVRKTSSPSAFDPSDFRKRRLPRFRRDGNDEDEEEGDGSMVKK
jgi:hypothetical protein